MQIKIPRFVMRAADAFADWVNVPVSRRFIRLDILLVLIGLAAIAQGYLLDSGWQGALLGFLLYVLVVMTASWM